MIQQDSNSSTVLSWVRPDLDKHLNQVRIQIENIADNIITDAIVEHIEENLIQLKYTFETLVLKGATLVVEEMIAVCNELKNHRIRDPNKAYSAMMGAIVVLPSYLDRLQAGQHDLPILLLPVINELRSAYEANIVSESTLFTPDLDVPLPDLSHIDQEIQTDSDEPIIDFARRIRRQWENTLLHWLQQQDNTALLTSLQSVCKALMCRLERVAFQRMWWIASEVIGGLRDGAIDNDIHLRRLFARLNLTLKTISEDGEKATDAQTVNAVSQALLFHVAQAKTDSAAVDRLKDIFRLREIIPDRDVLMRARSAMTGRNRELYMSLGASIRDELSLVKDALDLELRTGELIPEQRLHSQESLLMLQDTLKMLGLGDSARSLEKLVTEFNTLATPEQTPDRVSSKSILMDLAEELIRVESDLDEQIETLGDPLPEVQNAGYIDLPVFEQRRIRTRLLDETVISLHQVQNAICRHFSGDQKADFTSPMEHIAGALELIDEPETASLALKLRNALENLLRLARSETAVGVERLEIVTDAVAAFELYLTGCRDQQGGRGQFLEILKDRLKQLPVGEMEVVEPDIASPPDQDASLAEDTSTAAQTAPPSAMHPSIEPELLDTFLEDYESITTMLNERIPEWLLCKNDLSLLSDLRRGFHTIKGSGLKVGANELGNFALHIEKLLNALLERNIESFEAAAVILALAEAALPELKCRLLQQPSDLTSTAIESIIQQADGITAGDIPEWASLREVLPAKFANLLPSIEMSTPETAGEPPATDAEPVDPTPKDRVLRVLEENLPILKGLMDRISRDHQSTANETEIEAAHSIAIATALHPTGKEPAVARTLEGFLKTQRQSGMTFNNTAMWMIASSLSCFETCLTVHEEDAEATFAVDQDQLIEQLVALTAEFKVHNEIPEEQPELAEFAEKPEDILDKPREVVDRPETVTDEPEEISGAPTTGSSDEQDEPSAGKEDTLTGTGHEPVDPEILRIFLEEATFILERCDSLLNAWRDNLPDLGIVQNLQREFHTFKGGSRMAGLNALGSLSHSMETLMERIAGQQLVPSVPAIEILEKACDLLNTWTEQVGQGTYPQAEDALKSFDLEVSALDSVAVPLEDITTKIIAETEEPATVSRDASNTKEEPEAVTVESQDTELESQLKRDESVTGQQETTRLETPKEELRELPEVVVPGSELDVGAGTQQIRVNADLLDSLVNSAGEISIFRSLLEQKVNQMREYLKELDVTTSRLREQFRKLEIETETQVHSRYPEELPDHSEDFDPLEMDRFSSLQQLSRSFSESVSDLLNLQELLDDAARKSEALLVQQSRVSQELQEGLMQTRMVHFGTIAPRLRRIVRTSSAEIGKNARLQLHMTGGGDQLDRNVLERITAPLEHLLRNSIVHGIESPATRSKLNKPVEGQLSITVAAEATEFVIRVADDGAGINLKAVHNRAIQMGLIDKNSGPSSQQLMQLILKSGFSTSRKVTALAGRGVGMDVVNSKIKQIGGSVEIHSEAGKGCCFTIRIPFTLAVMQAIGITAGERRYLIPLASVAGVARMLPSDYQSLLEQEKPHYDFADESNPILDLEPLLGEPSTPLGDLTISMLMIKSGEQRAAFRVAELLGHKEIVIKPVGPQISSVPGILGGTITADGKVVVIIDTGPLIRQALLKGARPVPPIDNISIRPQKTIALIVDDSITMRKVTTRVLESHNFEVITARDGVDATEQMLARIPDVLLLDVEMPRMDGYKLAEYVRADARLRHIPIVMITSRAGKKHRDRARQAGADSYLPKPYKESELISEVNKLLEASRS